MVDVTNVRDRGGTGMKTGTTTLRCIIAMAIVSGLVYDNVTR